MFKILSILSLSLLISFSLHAEKMGKSFMWGVHTKSIDKAFGLSVDEKYQIAIAKESLGTMLLLKTAHISNIPTPTGSALANKIIYFEKRIDHLYMFESTDGKVSSISVPTKILLAKFKIKKETEDFITFNFEEGMNLSFIRSSMYVSDFPESSREGVAEIVTSFVAKVEEKDGRVFIDQYVHLKDGSPKPGADVFRQTQIKYCLSEYKKNPNFKPKKSDGLTRVGFFELHPQITAGSGEKTVYILRFDHNKPITYFISSNVPEEYYQAVADGILYWNKVFQKGSNQS